VLPDPDEFLEFIAANTIPIEAPAATMRIKIIITVTIAARVVQSG
jgi:hypothetical protein